MTQLKTAFIFPGQGESHSVGMGHDFYQNFALVRHLFEEANDELKYDLKKLMFEGPLEELSKTKYCQAAIFVVSMAVLKVIQKEYPSLVASYSAGLSLGEYSAVCAASSLTFSQGLQLVHARGSLMQQACLDHPSTMAVVLGMAESDLQQVINDLKMPQDLWLANLNCPGQIVVSGTHRGIEALIPSAKEAGAKRVLPLNVAGAFHSPLMQSAATELEQMLSSMDLKAPQNTLMMNVTGDSESNVDKIKENLILQITHPVRWQACVEKMSANAVESFIEIGCGKVLTGLNKRMGLLGQTCCINSVKDLELLKNKMTLVN